MKFDTLYKIMINEADIIEDGEELDGIDMEKPSDDMVETDGDTDITDDISVKPETRDERIKFLMGYLPEYLPSNKHKTPEQLLASAQKIADSTDNFDLVWEYAEERKAERSSILDPLSGELGASGDVATPDDIVDVSQPVRDYESEKAEEEAEAEEDPALKSFEAGVKGNRFRPSRNR